MPSWEPYQYYYGSRRRSKRQPKPPRNPFSPPKTKGRPPRNHNNGIGPCICCKR